MKKMKAVLAVCALLAPMSSAHGQRSNHSFTVHVDEISGAPTGGVSLSGGGTYDPGTGSLHAGGGFRCTRDVDQGPLAGCRAGEGVRWEGFELLPSTGFKCTGGAGEPLKTAVTDDDTIAMRVHFFRAGDGTIPSFTASVFVSAADEDPNQPGTQNVWIAGVGCAEAAANVR